MGNEMKQGRWGTVEEWLPESCPSSVFLTFYRIVGENLSIENAWITRPTLNGWMGLPSLLSEGAKFHDRWVPEH